MFSLVKQSGNYKYNLQRFVCDTVDDLPTVAPHGSTAIVLDSNGYYLLAAEGWVALGGEAPTQEYALTDTARTDVSIIQ